MRTKATDGAWRKKARSLETMLSRERVHSRQVVALAESAIKALEESNNGEVKEAVQTLREAGEALARFIGSVRSVGDEPRPAAESAGAEA